MSANQLFILQENSSSDFVERRVTPVADQVLGFDSSLVPVMKSLPTGGGETVVTSVSSLTNINCSLGSYYTISISASATISLANVTAAKIYTLWIYNSSTVSITITLPTGGYASNPSYKIGPYLAREFSFISAGGSLRWQVSDEVTLL